MKTKTELIVNNKLIQILGYFFLKIGLCINLYEVKNFVYKIRISKL
jgi:hypothetical protein